MNWRQYLSTDQVVRVQHTVPRKRTLMWLIACCLFIFLPILSYQVGQFFGNRHQSLQLAKQEQLVKLSTALQHDLQLSEQQTIYAQTELSIQKNITKQLQQKLLEWNNKYAIAEQKIDLYRSILEGNTKSMPLSLAYISINPIDISNTAEHIDSHRQNNFELQAIAIQYAVNRKLINAELSIAITAENTNGKEIVLHTKDLLSLAKLKFKFKYLHRIKQNLTLPVDIKPKSLTLSLQSPTINKKIVENIPWDKIISASSGSMVKDINH